MPHEQEVTGSKFGHTKGDKHGTADISMNMLKG